jgi:hypothetical protein
VAGDTLLREDFLPRDWVIFALSSDYASPAGLIAAVLPALMAGAGRILICRAGADKRPWAESVSAALELLGQEYLYTLNAVEGLTLMRELADQSDGGAGGVVVLGSCEESALWLNHAFSLGLPVRVMPHGLRFMLDAGSERSKGVEVDEALLRWLHPSAEFFYRGADDGVGSYDAVFSGDRHWLEACAAAARNGAEGLRSRLMLEPGQEFFWIWPDLAPGDFSRRIFALAPSKGAPPANGSM